MPHTRKKFLHSDDIDRPACFACGSPIWLARVSPDRLARAFLPWRKDTVPRRLVDWVRQEAAKRSFSAIAGGLLFEPAHRSGDLGPSDERPDARCRAGHHPPCWTPSAGGH